MSKAPVILVFDSGLGGLTVFSEIVRLRPDAHFFYAADDAGFPYGRLSEEVLIARVLKVLGKLITDVTPDVVVVACNTASTLVLPHLRAAYPAIPFVGTVPAVKPAAQQSRSKVISVLATPGTVARDYTHDLVRTYAAHCDVSLIGSQKLASLAEAYMKGETVADVEIVAEIEPCFVEVEGKKTDCVVLACTHYPLLITELARLAPWPVDWIDPSSAIARRVDHVLCEDLGFKAHNGQMNGAAVLANRAIFTGDVLPPPDLDAALRARHFEDIVIEPMPL